MKNLFILSALILSVFLNCTTSKVYVDISYERYSPGFQTDKYTVFKGKEIFLSSFDNKANNTSVFYYFSPDSRIQYGEYVIASYYWYCFEKVFNNVGMTTFNDNAPSDIPKFTFVFDYLTDRKITYKAALSKRLKTVYQRSFEITLPPPDSEDKKYLENRAYQMVDRIITNILDDPDFAAAL